MKTPAGSHGVTSGLLLQRSVAMNQILGGGVLGHSLGTLGHGVHGQLTGEEQTNSGLNLPRGYDQPFCSALPEGWPWRL